MEYKCEECNRSFNSEESLRQHNSVKHMIIKKKRRSMKKFIVLFLVLAIIVFLFLAIFINAKRPGKFDDFAKCLTEKGAVMYGNDFCQFSNQQFGSFGKSKKYLNYVRCIENEELCNSKGVRITPTWEIDGDVYQGIQSFSKLSALSGCEV